jgi:hypothetical protein
VVEGSHSGMSRGGGIAHNVLLAVSLFDVGSASMGGEARWGVLGVSIEGRVVLSGVVASVGGSRS